MVQNFRTVTCNMQSLNKQCMAYYYEFVKKKYFIVFRPIFICLKIKDILDTL